jgi:outer membrane receptor protein involved in Fe transport
MTTNFRLSALALALSAAWPALAQQAPATPPASEDESQRVVITANKRAEKQRDVAGTVSVLSGDDLERRAVVDQEGALKLTPGVQVNKGDPGTNNISIRGLTTQGDTESGSTQRPTGFYLEDVSLNSPFAKGIVDILPFDLDRVEVLRGPQGALFGSGSLGGAVRYLYAKPNLKSFEASVLGSVSKVSSGGSGVSMYGMVNAPIADGTAALRVVAFDRKDPGYLDNLGTNTKDANEVRQRGGRLLFTTKPTKAFTATLVISTQKTDQDDRFYSYPDSTKLEHTAPTNGTAAGTFDFSNLTLDLDLGGHTLTSITGYWKAKAKGQGDDTELLASLGFVVPAVIRPFDNSSKSASQELRIANKPGGPLSYLAGVSYQTTKGNGSAQQIVNGAAALFGTDRFALVDLTTASKATETALFVDGEYGFGGGWSAGLGGRYYRTKTNYRQEGFVFPAPSLVEPPAGSDSGTTPKLTVKYRFADNVWYALASKGYRFGGVNGNPPYRPYKSDSLWNYETGLRMNPSPGVQLDLTAFMLDWKDAQFTFYDPNPGGIPFSGIANVGKARSKGLEGAARFRVSAAFEMAASLAYLDAKTTSDVVTSPGQVINSGTRLPGSARLQAALQANLRFTGPLDSKGRFNATYTHVGSRYTDLAGSYVAPAYDTLDLGLSIARENWTLATNLNNATDERGILSRTGSPFLPTFGQYYLQRPRTLTVSLRYDH